MVVLGRLVGVAKFGIAAGARGSITVQGVFEIVKDPTTNIPAGTILYWSKISHHVIKNQYDHSMIGISVEDAPPSTPPFACCCRSNRLSLSFKDSHARMPSCEI